MAFVAGGGNVYVQYLIFWENLHTNIYQAYQLQKEVQAEIDSNAYSDDSKLNEDPETLAESYMDLDDPDTPLPARESKVLADRDTFDQLLDRIPEHDEENEHDDDESRRSFEASLKEMTQKQ